MMLCGEDVDIRMRDYERLMRDGGGEPLKPAASPI
jgi:hypothetical protein